MNNDWLDILNEPQRQAVTKTEGPLLVIAGAGSGKTRAITYRVAYLIRELGIAPWQILAVTFTNKAALEMRERVQRLAKEAGDLRYSISTFHSTCASLLRRECHRVGLTRNFTICDETDQRGIIKDVMRELKIDTTDVQPSQAQWIINQAKMRMLGPDDVSQIFQSPFEEQYVDIFKNYKKMMAKNDACDFEDLILKCVLLFDEDDSARREIAARWPYILVDEYQDTNFIQFRFLEALAREKRNLCVVGDEDQSIYSWRGAEITNLLDFKKHFPEAELIRLEQNYRSHGNILKAASHIIENNEERLGKTLWTKRQDGPPLYLVECSSDRDESSTVVSLLQEIHERYSIPYNEMAIFFRTNALSRIFEDRLRAWSMPYRVIGGIRFYDRKEIKDLLSYMKVAANPNNSIALLRVINTPRRGIGGKSMDQILGESTAKDLTVFQALKLMAQEDRLPRGAKKKIPGFIEQVEKWQKHGPGMGPGMLLENILKDTGYIEALGDENALEVITRRENINELKASMIQYEKEYPNATLDDYLEMVSLTSFNDNDNANEDCISLMTFHAAKGLEFSIVCQPALDNGFFPSQRSLDDGNLEEERRLFYVGITRAKDMVIFSRANSRFYNGRQAWCQPSMFLRELPREQLDALANLDEDAIADFAPLRRVKAEVAQDALEKDREFFEKTFKKPAARIQQNLDSKMAHARQLAREDKNKRASKVEHLEVGMRVSHPLLGTGEILKIEQLESDDKITLLFEDGAEQAIYGRFAKLTILD